MGALEGTSAIVTGAGRGIGRAEALLLASEGSSVIVNDVDAAEAGAVVEEIRAAGGTADANDDDIATWGGAEAAVGHVVDRYGRLDILVNNAGIIHDVMSFSMDEDQWDRVVAVHLKGHAAMSHFAGAHWRGRAKSGEDGVWGRIVNTASESGLYGLAGQINYATAKAGIASMTIVLGRELRKYGVTANAIAPRARTRMTETVLTGMEPEAGQFDEWDPANVAPVVAWLARPSSKDITGQVFVVNGDKVHLMEGWHRVGRVDNGGERWTIDSLDEAAADLFGERSTKLPPAGFGE
jgi:3-oxoacyl-[acyl-carrier protein] reductase